MKIILAFILFIIGCVPATDPEPYTAPVAGEYQLTIIHVRLSGALPECEINAQVRLWTNGTGWAIGTTTCFNGGNVPLESLTWKYNEQPGRNHFTAYIGNTMLDGNRNVSTGEIKGAVEFWQADGIPGTGQFHMRLCNGCFPVTPK